ncbi:MAG: hypothetical protein WCT41_01740 [Candidatus Paceibacterota bacterium]|jgi:hypothetical protein
MSKKQGSNPPVRATVKNIVNRQSAEGSYAVAYSTEDYGELKKSDSITFSLSNWHGKGQRLNHGQVVELRNVALFRHGWRATLAFPVIPTSKQHIERNTP